MKEQKKCINTKLIVGRKLNNKQYYQINLKKGKKGGREKKKTEQAGHTETNSKQGKFKPS